MFGDYKFSKTSDLGGQEIASSDVGTEQMRAAKPQQRMYEVNEQFE